MNRFHYRHFIYLDSDEILNIATAMRGADVEEELNTLTRGFGGDIGAKFGFATLGANLSLQSKKEWKLRQTAYSAADKVLKNLNPEETDLESVSSARENTVIQCDVNLRPLRVRSGEDRPLVRAEQLIHPWWRRLFRPDLAGEARYQNVCRYGDLQAMQVGIFSNHSNGSPETRPLLMTLEPKWILNPGEFSRRATVVGQIIGVRRPGEEIVPTRDNSGAWFEFRQVSAQADNQSKAISGEVRTEDLLPGLPASDKVQQDAGVMLSEAPSGISRVPAGGGYSPTSMRKGKAWRWLFWRKREKVNTDEEFPARLDLKLGAGMKSDESWPSVVLRPIMIFK